jgi:hypothetical protein
MERGTSLLEMLVTLSLGAIALACTSTGVMAGARLYAALSSTTEATIARQKTNAALSAALRALDRHRINGGWRVVSGTDLVGTKHPLSKLKGTSAPRELSDILSVVETSPIHRGRIVSSHLNDTHVELRACDFPSPLVPSDTKSLLILGSSGLLHVSANIPRETQGCIDLRGNRLNSIFSTYKAPACSFHTLLPIEREYSVFVDRTSQLRLVSHLGGQIIENQPISRGISFVRITPRHDSSGAMIFSVTIKPIGGPASTTTAVIATTRRALWNEILL